MVMSIQITTDLIKKLRDRTGIGMAKCKEALEEANGDIELAIANLRKAGMASAVKKEGRETNEGMIGSGESKTHFAIAEVNAETDFVVKNDRFQKFLVDIIEEIAKTHPASIEAFLQQPYSKEPSLTIDQYRATIVQAIGENIQISRLKTFEKNPNRSIGIYSHMNGKIVTAVVIEGSPNEGDLAKEIAMHTAAAAPEYLNPESVPSEVIAQEKEIAKSQIKGKPDNIVEKIVEGKVNSFFDASCLTRQKFIKDDTKTISGLLDERSKQSGKPLKIVNFIRWGVGQA
jgi:elongation factor Ts